MHPLDFFRRRGFYCVPDFLDEPARAALLGQVRRAVPTRAGVFDGRPASAIDTTVRDAWKVTLDDGVAAELDSRLGALRSPLSDHFKTPLSGHEGPTLLMYEPGGFYEPHVDGSRFDDPQIQPVHRRVSVVIFLNAMRTPPGPADYSGGALTFYGIVDDPAWRRFGFALEPAPGLLVAFPSHVVHEVPPVTAGDRYTVVDWFIE